ncbi:fibronectin-like isoform X2 [Mytilus californianus]|uniref:fibronectin-like isoform X2 n=1 Tax=Mytilus californianus TaxID=6549 RepID=UPI0022455DEA|nr:fibronectin-like isoform X2 [Mytilus californianus]
MEQKYYLVIFDLIVCLLCQVRCLAPPVGLRAYAISPNVFRVKWIDKYRNSKRSTQFTLRYRNIPGEDQYKYLNTTKVEVKRLNVITSNGSYEFSVKAVRGRKESKWSDPVKNTFDSEVAVGPPRGLKIKDSTPTSIKIKWRRPKTKRNLISGYRVTWKMLGNKISNVKQTTLRSLLISKLKPSSTYIIKVQAMDKSEELSEPTKISFRTKRKVVIRAPTNFTVEVYGSTKLVVKWGLPRGDDFKKITGYQIQYRQKGVQKGTLCTVVTTKKKQKYIITDLYKGQQYKVRIAAKSGHLTGKSTNWLVATLSGGNKTKIQKDDNEDFIQSTTESVQDQLQDKEDTLDIISVEVNKTDNTYYDHNVTMTCIVKYHGKGERSILWTKGDDLKVERIGAWFIDISGRHSFEESEIEEDDITTLVKKLRLWKLKTSDSGLYKCHVLNTDSSASLNFTVTDTSLGPPENIQAEVLSHNSIGVYWSPPTNSANLPMTYEVHCWRERHMFEYDYKHFVVKDIVQPEYVIDSLKYNTKYHIGVIAVNQFGRSNFTNVENVTVTTLDLPPLKIKNIRIINPGVTLNSEDRISSVSPSPAEAMSTTTSVTDTGEEHSGTAVEISWSNTSEAQNWPLKWTQHIIHYKTDDNNTIHQKSVWKNSTIIYKLENDKMYYFRIETVFPGKSIFSAWEKFSTYLTEKTSPPPPKDMYLTVLANNSMVIKWLPPPQEYRVRVRQYQIVVAEEDGRKQFFRVDEQIRKFLVHNLDRSKDYTVEIAAINNIGESDKIVRFLEAFRNISNGIYISAKPLSSTSVQVSWTTSYNSDLTRYLLRYNTIKSAASQPVDSFVKPSVMSHVMNNLQQHTEYIISLIPYFNDMPGNLTMTTVWTYSDVPSAPPKDVTVLSVNNSNFMVSWNPPPEHTRNGDLVYYRLEYRTKYDETSKTMLVPADKNEMLLSGLEEGIVYEMRVAAVTVNGTGPYSSWVQMVVTKSGTVIEQPPEPPSNLTADPVPLGITLMWASPLNTSIPVKGYIVGHGRFIPEVYRKILGPSVFEYTITGLRPNAQYILTVRSFNSFGESKPAFLKAKSGKRQQNNYEITTIVATTPETTPVPGAPYDVRIKERGEEVPTVLVTWKRPNIKEHIKGYILLYTNDSSLPIHQWTGVYERSLQYIIKNLAFNTTYFIRIQCQLDDRSGIMSKIIFFTTRSVDKSKDTLPNPKIMSAFSGSDYIQITWQPPDYAYIIRGYILGYGIQQPGEYQEMLPFSETTFKIKKLAPETVYHISLRSFGEFGESERAVLSVTTTA